MCRLHSLAVRWAGHCVSRNPQLRRLRGPKCASRFLHSRGNACARLQWDCRRRRLRLRATSPIRYLARWRRPRANLQAAQRRGSWNGHSCLRRRRLCCCCRLPTPLRDRVDRDLTRVVADTFQLRPAQPSGFGPSRRESWVSCSRRAEHVRGEGFVTRRLNLTLSRAISGVAPNSSFGDASGSITSHPARTATATAAGCSPFDPAFSSYFGPSQHLANNSGSACAS
jgi:hypothetical protein